MKLSLSIYKRWPPKTLNLHYHEPESILYKLRSSLSFAPEYGQSQFIVFLDVDLVGLRDSWYLVSCQGEARIHLFYEAMSTHRGSGLEHACFSYPPIWFRLIGTMDFLIPISRSRGLKVFLSE